MVTVDALRSVAVAKGSEDRLGPAALDATARDHLAVSAAGAVLQAGFDDLYSAVYEVLDDAKIDHDLVKLYKGSHGSPNPHPVVLDFGEFFFRERRGLIGYACQKVNPNHPPTLADLDVFNAEQKPRIDVRAAFELLAAALRRPDESYVDVLAYLTSRTHDLGAYRGGSSGYDDETRAFAATAP